MRRRLCAVLLLGITAISANAADKPSGVTGLYLTTRYPALTVRAAEESEKRLAQVTDAWIAANRDDPAGREQGVVKRRDPGRT